MTSLLRRGPRVRRHQGRRTALLLAVVPFGVAVGLFGGTVPSFERLELDTVDARFQLRGPEPPPRDIALVTIDEATFDAFRAVRADDPPSAFRGQWPFPRRVHARVLRNLHRDGARVVAFDVQFTEPSRYGVEDDFALFETADRARPVVFAATAVDSRGRTSVLGGDENLRAAGARAGHALLPNDPRGVVRRIPYSVARLPAFGVAAVQAAGEDPPRPQGGSRDGAWYIDFAGPAGTIPATSFSDVYNRRFRPGTFRGKIVVVGPSAPTLQDLHAVSVGGEEQMAGAEIQANAIATARTGFPLRVAPRGWRLAALLLLGAAIPLLCLARGARVAIVGAALLTAGYLVAAKLLFDGGTIVSVVPPLLTVVAATAGSGGVQYLTEVRERRRLRTLFGRFVPESVVDEVVERADEDLRLGGVRLEATVLFSDLRGFTTFAERLDPQQVIETLNVYLGEMSDAILEAGGTLVAYMGDGIMAVFGAPIEQPDHADRAFSAAVEMLGPRLDRFNRWMRDEGHEPFRMGIGINSGPVMSGNVGSERRVEYTAVGDTTNTAARLEGMTKGTPFQLLVSETTRALLSAAPSELVEHGNVEVRGRAGTLRVWALPDEAVRVSTSG